MLKKIYLSLIALLTMSMVNAQNGLPTFSTEAEPVWHFVEFKTGGHFMSDAGAGSNLTTVASVDNSSQVWIFIGTKDNFTMKSLAGNYVSWDGSWFKTSKNASDAVAMKFVAGTQDGTWEFQRTGSNKCMNQNGGTAVGVKLGEWNVNDPNNPTFIEPYDISAFESPYIEPVFSDDSNVHWFMIQFAKNGNHLASGGVGEQARTARMSNTKAQYWKFVGNANKFQLVSKDGSYATIKNNAPATNGQTGNLVYMQAEADASGFKIEKTGNANYPDAYEIRYNGTTSDQNTFNQWGGAEAGMSIGLWKGNNDDNNPLYIYLPSGDLISPFELEPAENHQPENALTLWYTNAASNMPAGDQWMEYSLPIGNGQFGASIFGGIAQEQVQFNEKTLWSGTKNDNGTEYGDYENFGSVYINDISNVFSEDKPVKEYYRDLDLTNATASVHYKSADGTSFTREYIASNPDKVVAMRFTADKKGQIGLNITLAAGRPGIRANTTYNDGTATFSGKLETVSYKALLKVVPTGGEMTTDAKGIKVTGADEVMIILGGATDFDAYADNYTSGTSELAALVEKRVNDAASKSWATIYNAHVEDYKHYFDRCSFELVGSANTMPTDDLVRQYEERQTGVEDYALMLEQIYFAYGRYLEISSSRGVDLPSNLQGIWNNSSEPAWNADIHSNINVQMNYWPAEPTNLSELHLPFLNYIINMAESEQWKKYAKDAGETRGWTCYTENNIFGGVGSFMHAYVIANAWYCSHLWQHYRYTLDKEFLAKAFPAMWSASMFWMDRLKLASDGSYVCPNEYSPEHGPTEDGVAHAQQLVWELFDNTLDAVEILGEANVDIEAQDLTTLKTRFEKLDPGLAIEKYDGNWGTAIANGADILREWKYSTYTKGQNGHRHMSHLMCLYPFSQVTPESEYFDAAINSMKLRGDASTGWSMGWKINLWARALDGDHSHDILELALRHHSKSGGGVYYNLYDSHSPFQIDGNFGACAGIAEMLFQSHTEVLDILPALPSVWKSGSIRGLKAVGDFTVDIKWKDGKATFVRIINNQGQPCKVKCNDFETLNSAKVYLNGKETTVSSDAENKVISVESKAGDEIVFDISGEYITAIENVIVENSDDATYDLTGRKVENTTVGGIYIKNGEKFLVK